MLRQVVAPVLAAYLLCVALVLLAARTPSGRADHRPAALTRDRLTALIRYVALLEIGSYGTLLVIVGIFSVLIVGDREALWSAAWGAGFLLLVATPVFVVLSTVVGRRSRRSI
ncbi:MAG TPA: DUF6256 family protein [Actinomycetota bacterium]